MADGLTFYNNPYRVTGAGTGKRKPFIMQRADASNQNCPHSTTTLIDVLETTVDKSGIVYNSTNHRFVVPAPGEYVVHVKINYASEYTGGNDDHLAIRRNGSNNWPGSAGLWYVPDSQGTTWYKSFHNEVIVPCSRNDYIDFTFWQNSGADRIISGTMGYCYIHLL